MTTSPERPTCQRRLVKSVNALALQSACVERLESGDEFHSDIAADAVDAATASLKLAIKILEAAP
jgi:hypothetical protein